jgi:hypothetical protein
MTTLGLLSKVHASDQLPKFLCNLYTNISWKCFKKAVTYDTVCLHLVNMSTRTDSTKHTSLRADSV